MRQIISALVFGMIFGVGIAVAGMANPAKVLNFFDIAGIWDPSLAFVMGGALFTAIIGYRLIFSSRKQPLFGERFHLPTSKDIDLPLVTGASVFGIGWGIAGFCPGGSIPALGLGHQKTVIFFVSMAIGIFIAKTMRTRMEAAAAA